MYRVLINYGGTIIEEFFRTEKQAQKRYAAWYIHGLDMVGQIKSTIDIYYGDKCILSDRY